MDKTTREPHLVINEIDCTIMSHSNISESDHFSSAEQYEMTIRLCRLNVYIWNTIPPIFLVAGTFGNVLSIVIWSRSNMRKQTQHLNVILIWLAIGDLMVLYTGISRHFLRKASYIQWDIQRVNDFLCKFHEFLIYFSLSFSAWIIVFIAIERCTCILCIRGCGALHHSKPCVPRRLARPQSLYLVILLLVVACSGVNAHFFWSRKLTGRECRNNRAEMPYFLDHIWPKVDLFFTSVVPCTLILLSTATLSVAVCCCHSSSLDSVRGRTRSGSECAKGRSRSVVIRKSNKITWTLIGIALAFILCVCPTRIFLVIFPSRMPESARRQPLEFFKYRSVWALLLMLEYLTYVINFMIYSLSNERFRKEARRIFCRRRVRNLHSRMSVSSVRNIATNNTNSLHVL